MEWEIQTSREIEDIQLSDNTRKFYTIEIENNGTKQRAFKIDETGRNQVTLKWALEVLKDVENEGA